MHELSIVMRIVDIAEEQVKKNHARQVDTIELEIGELAGVERDAFEFAWPSAVKGTVLNRARKEIRKIVGRASCHECDCEFVVHEAFESCPACGSYFCTILQGKELRVKSLVLS